MTPIHNFIGIVCFCCYITAPCYAQQDSVPQKKHTLLPETHLVPLFTSDSRAHRLGLQAPLGDNGYIASMGGIFPVWNISTPKHQFQVSAASTVYTTLRRWTDKGRLINIDFFVDFFFDYSLNNNIKLRSAIGHTSQHLSDDALNDLNIKAINYTRDYVQLFWVHQISAIDIRYYVGCTYNSNFKTTSSLGVILIPQFGTEYSFFKWRDRHALYVAGDIKLRGERDYKPTQNYQLGYRLGKPEKRVMRLVINHSIGVDERGQFYTQDRQFTTIGTLLDF